MCLYASSHSRQRQMNELSFLSAFQNTQGLPYPLFYNNLNVSNKHKQYLQLIVTLCWMVVLCGIQFINILTAVEFKKLGILIFLIPWDNRDRTKTHITVGFVKLQIPLKWLSNIRKRWMFTCSWLVGKSCYSSNKVQALFCSKISR